MSPEKIIGVDANTTSTLDFIFKPNSNETHGTETNDSIDISMQLSDHSDYSSKIISNENDDNRPLMDHNCECLHIYKIIFFISLIQYLTKLHIVLDQSFIHH